MRLAAVLALLLLAAAPAAAKPGDLDHSFGRGGALALTVGPGWSQGGGLLLRPGGGLLLSGASRDGVVVAALHRDGALAAHWTAPIGNFDYFYASPGGMARDAEGRIYVAAFVEPGADLPGGPQQLSVLRFLPAGGLDPSYRHAPFYARRALVPGALAVAPDGTATLAVTLGEGTRSQIGAVRFRPDGRPDRRFGSGGLAVVAGHASGDAVVLRRDTAIVGGGNRREHSPATFVLAEVDGRGRLVRLIRDQVAHRPGRLVSGITDMVLEPGGTLLAAGIVGQGFERHFGVARYDARGHRVALGIVGPNGGLARAIALDRRGRVIVAGENDVLDAGGQALVARLTPALEPDPRFGSRGFAAFDLGSNPHIVASEVTDVAVTPGGRIVVAGSTYDDDPDGIGFTGRSYFAVARLLAR